MNIFSYFTSSWSKPVETISQPLDSQPVETLPEPVSSEPEILSDDQSYFDAIPQEEEDLFYDVPDEVFKIEPDFMQFATFIHRLGKNLKRIIVGTNGQLRNVSLEHTEEAKAQNEETWSVFKRAIERQFSPQRIDRIFASYGIKWDEIKNEDPFKHEYVSYFGADAGIVRVEDLDEPEKLTCDELRTLYEEKTASIFLGDYVDPKKLHGAPDQAHEHFKCNHFLQTKRLATLFQGIETLGSKNPNIPRLAPYYSRLVMAIICHLSATEKDVGLVIPAPGEKDGDLDFFKVHSVVSEKGLTAFFLVPLAKDSTLTPTVLFRCTNQAIWQNNAMHAVRNCLTDNIGQEGWDACKEAIGKVMNDPTFTLGKKVDTGAYSLGGSHQGYFVNEHLDQLEKVWAYNAVGNEPSVANQVAKKINEAPPEYKPPIFTHIRNIYNQELGDCVNSVGKRVGCDLVHPNADVTLIEMTLSDKPPPDPNDPFQRTSFDEYHAVRIEDDEPCYEKDFYHGPSANEKLNPAEFKPEVEEKRKNMGEIFLKLGWPLYEIIEFLFALFDIALFTRKPPNSKSQ